MGAIGKLKPTVITTNTQSLQNSGSSNKIQYHVQKNR
jgi:hypothetical protein